MCAMDPKRQQHVNVSVHSDVSSARTTIAVQLPGNMPPHFAEAAKRKLEYELQKMHHEMQGAMIGNNQSAFEMLQRQQRAQMQVMMQAYSPYQGMLAGGLQQAAQAQSAPAKAVKQKKKVRKTLLLCEVKNAV